MLNDEFVYAHHLLRDGLYHSEHDEDPADPLSVHAMQIVLRIEKPSPASRYDLLNAAARSAISVCLDGRVATDPHYRDSLKSWYNHRIRKVTRRARNLAWQKAQRITGVTVDDIARACLPTLVSQVPKEIKALQISGTDLAATTSRPVNPKYPTVCVDAGLAMSLGKIAAQVGHATMLLAASKSTEWVYQWMQSGFALNIVEIDSVAFSARKAEPDAIIIRDAGFTEVTPGAITCVANTGSEKLP